MGAVIEAVEQQGKPFVFVVNAAIPRTHIALDAVRALAQHGAELCAYVNIQLRKSVRR